ncbi:MAG: hypothetical protein K0U93_08520 [Gammaproteobacteria bacterium]|nr:hypothetical protein [Gammaproteobacteria bacterium]
MSTPALPKRFLFVGKGKFAVDAIKIVKRLSPQSEIFVLTEPEPNALGLTLAKFCDRQGIAYAVADMINAPSVVEQAARFAPHFGISANNFRILKAPLINVPSEGFVNFHNGPLPRYGGLNVCSWALLNGESQYGVTWHFIDEGIDTGDVLAQRLFAVTQDMTGLKLVQRCIKEGISVFEELAPQLLDGSLVPRKQDFSQASYFSRKDTPALAHLNFDAPYAELERIVRALDFHPFPPTFVLPSCAYEGRPLYLQRISRAPRSEGESGRINEVHDDGIIVNCGDAALRIIGAYDDGHIFMGPSELAGAYQLKVGKFLQRWAPTD